MSKSKARQWPREIVVGSVRVKVYEVDHTTAASGKAYVVAYVTPSGRKTRKFSDPDKAISEARLQAEQLAAGKVEAADMTGGERDELLAAKKITLDVPVLSALSEWKKARDLCGDDLLAAAQAWRDLHGKSRKEISVRDAVKEFLLAKDRQGVDTKASYRKTLPRLEEAPFADSPMSSVSAIELEKWIHATFKQGENLLAHPATFNTLRKRLVTLWKWARKNNYLPKSAQTEAEQLESAREERESIGILTIKDFTVILRLIRAQHADHLAVTVLAGFAGLRRTELHGQKWSDVNLARGFLKVTHAKKNTPAMRLVHLSPAAVAWLRKCPGQKRDPDELISPKWGLDTVRKVARNAKIPCPENGFRHSFISYLVAKTGDVPGTALEAGNTAGIIFRHYRELVSKAEGKEWFDLSPSVV